jgi:acetyl-CoA acetyltransferase
MAERGDAAIVGLGITEMGKVYGRTAAEFAADAVVLAVQDAGFELHDVDGLLISAGVQQGVGLSLARDLGLRNLSLLSEVQGYGSTAGGMVAMASMAVQSGMANTVACVFADAPLVQGGSAGAAYGGGRRSFTGIGGLSAASGLVSTNAMYALAARRHMQKYGTTTEQFGAIAVAQRAWATMNPRAQMRDAITIEDHQSSRMIADPLHLLDCCLVSNGGVAVIVTNEARARASARPAVYVLGWGQTHPGYTRTRGSEFGLVSGAAISGPIAMKMAGVSVGDINVRELYDCYTYTALISLEDYGFCEKGEGGALAESGVLGPGGSLPTNTGGGQLSSYYMWGFTPLSEAVIQTRGEGGERQVAQHDVVLVSGNGGVLDHHSTLILSPHPRS